MDLLKKVTLSCYTFILLPANLLSCGTNEVSEAEPAIFKSTLDSYILSTSNMLMRSWCRAERCRSEVHDNILLRNDSLFVEGKVNDEWGQFARKLKLEEKRQLESYLLEYSSIRRSTTDERDCGGWTSFYLKKNDIVVDSIVDFRFEWSEKEIEFLRFIAELVSAGKLNNIGYKDIYYPSAKMVAPPGTSARSSR